MCVQFLDQTTLQKPHIKEILESISHPSVSLNARNICGQSYDGAAVMSSEIAGVQPKIKQFFPSGYVHSLIC